MNKTLIHRGPPYERVFFDCDSTLCSIEGLDALGERAGLAAQLVPITQAAMEGRLDLGTAYAERLALLQPDQTAIDWLTGQYQEHLTSGAATLVHALQQAGKQVHIVSGGILQALLPLAAPLNIPITYIHAVSLLFNTDGSYSNFDETSPLCQQHGKAVICRQLLGTDEHGVFIGDGVTDLEAAAAGIDFIGFGGVVRRSRVEAAATVYSSESDMSRLLPLLLTPAELRQADLCRDN